MRIIDRCRRLRLPDEPLPESLIARQSGRQNLQRHTSLKALIACPEYYCHPACADPLLQMVVSEPPDCRKAIR